MHSANPLKLSGKGKPAPSTIIAVRASRTSKTDKPSSVSNAEHISSKLVSVNSCLFILTVSRILMLLQMLEIALHLEIPQSKPPYQQPQHIPLLLAVQLHCCYCLCIQIQSQCQNLMFYRRFLYHRFQN